ncbi:MAG TPA: glycosyltransferase family 2 protein [Acidimicrobiales bacterium]|nr:glycosyltransferase family 2 protein [Acidimicrobiales bacterium]
MSTLPGTAAVVVTWRDAPMATRCVESLLDMDPGPDSLVCVALELDAQSLRSLAAALPDDARLIADPENIGFAAAANIGIETALEDGAQWVLVVNNDATLYGGYLDATIGRGGDEDLGRVAAVSPAISYAGDTDVVWFGGGHFSDRFGVARFRGRGAEARDAPPTGDVDWVPWCAVLVSAEAWRSVGPLREDFFLYFEDVEWCLRAREAGWRIRYVGRVLASHSVSASTRPGGSASSRADADRLSETSAYYRLRNPIRWALETPPGMLRVSRTVGIVVARSAYLGLQIARHPSRSVWRAYVAGIRHGLRGVSGCR